MRQTSQLDSPLLVIILGAVPLIYWPELKDYTLGPKLLVCLVPLAILLIRQTVARATLPTNPVLLPATLYVLLNAISLSWATDPYAGAVELSKLLSGFLLFCYVATRPRCLNGAGLSALVIAVTISALLGLLQNFDMSPWRIPSSGLPSGTLGFRNIAAMVTIQTIPFAVWKALDDRKLSRYWMTCVVLLVEFLIQTRTRGAWLGLVGATVITAWLHRQWLLEWSTNKKKVLLVLLVSLGIGIIPAQIGKMGPQGIDEKKETVADAVTSILTPGGDRGRLTVWQATLKMIVQNPFGVGLGNWSIEYPDYDQARTITFDASPSRPHNDFLWIASEVGLLGILAFAWMLFAAIRSGLRNISGRQGGIASAALASLIALMIHGCFSFPKDRAAPTLIFWLVLGVLGNLSRPRHHRSPMSWGLAASAAILLVAFISNLLAFESRMYQSLAPERRGDWNRVETLTAQAMDIGRFHPEALHLRGYALNTLARYDDAVIHYSDYEHLRPNDVQFLNGQAIALHNTGAHDKAERIYRRARELAAYSTDLDYNLATLLIQMKRPEEAITLLSKVERIEKPSAGLLFHLGNALALTGQNERSIDKLTASVAIEPANARVWIILGEVYLRSRRLEDAAIAFHKFLEYHRSDDRFARRARTVLESLQQKLED